MSEITKKDIQHIAHLARLDLTGGEEKKLTEDLVSILDFVSQLEQVDTSSIDVNMAQHKPVNQKRADEAKDSAIQEAIISQAPKRKDKYFEVKAVLD